MAWVTSYSGTSTVNKGTRQYGDEAMYDLKELLKSVGWTVMSSSDGTTYNSSGDQITHSGSGAGGYGNTSAWFRIQDPGALREYVFQRGVDGRYLKWMYSASAKFTGGSPDATTPPTATDEQGLARGVSTSQIMFPTIQEFHIAAQSTAHNGVYAWWLVGAAVQTTTNMRSIMLCDAMDVNYSSSDNDPCIHVGTEDSPTYAVMSASNAGAPDGLMGYMRKGEVDEEWEGLSTCYYYAGTAMYPYAGVINPHNGKYPLLHIPVMRHSSTGTTTGFKGVMKYTRWKPNANIKYPVILAEASESYLVWQDICLPGIPSDITPAT